MNLVDRYIKKKAVGKASLEKKTAQKFVFIFTVFDRETGAVQYERYPVFLDDLISERTTMNDTRKILKDSIDNYDLVIAEAQAL